MVMHSIAFNRLTRLKINTQNHDCGIVLLPRALYSALATGPAQILFFVAVVVVIAAVFFSFVENEEETEANLFYA